MKKQVFTLFFALALLVGAVPAAALEGEALRTADTLATLGLVDSAGAASGYNLDSPATRAQAALLLVQLAGAEAAARSAASAGFRDTPAWAANAINYAAGQGWISGISAQEFKPNSSITANAWCTMLLRMLGYSDKNGDFTVHDAPTFARRIGLLSQEHSGTMTRGAVFETMQETLTFPYKDGSGTVIQHLMDRGVCARSTASALGFLKKELTAREIADRHMSSVFCMDVFSSEEEIEDHEASGQASGFFITPDGLAVTNYHSIAGGIYAEATLVTGETYEVEEILYYDADIDIAVIQVSRTSLEGEGTSAFAFLELVGTDDIRSGDTVYTISNPLGLGLAVSSGIISSPAREVTRYDLPCIMNTADISEGSSGGALLNAYGQVIGVTSGAFTYGNNMYLAVPVDPAMEADLTAKGMTLAEVAELEDVNELDDEEA